MLDAYKRYREKNKEKKENYRLLYQYGITLKEKLELLEKQGGVCKICRCEFRNSRDKHTDHNHKTGVVRGVLCRRCNMRLGWLEKHLDSVKEYLKDPTI